jgi:hypothetical protein
VTPAAPRGTFMQISWLASLLGEGRLDEFCSHAQVEQQLLVTRMLPQKARSHGFDRLAIGFGQ